MFSREKSISSVHTGGVTWLDLDCVEERYLLAGAADGSVAAYDVQARRVLLGITATECLTSQSLPWPSCSNVTTCCKASNITLVTAWKQWSQVPVAVDASGAAQHDAVFKVDRGRVGHAFTVSSVVWYAIDTGLFVSGSFDKTVKARRHQVFLAAQRPGSAVPPPPCQLILHAQPRHGQISHA